MSAIIAKKCFDETFVDPQWLPGGQSFWYRRRMGVSKFRFIYVDINAGSSRSAFDHQQLVNALQKAFGGQVEVDPDELPFTWIDLEDSTVRFRFREQIWQYEPGRDLSKWPGSFTQGNPLLMRRQGIPKPTSVRATVAFVNSTRSELFLYFVDGEGKARPYGSISPGKTELQSSVVGHCWRLEEGNSSQLRGVYVVPNVAHSSVVVGEVDVEEYLGTEEKKLECSKELKDGDNGDNEADSLSEDNGKTRLENPDTKSGQENDTESDKSKADHGHLRQEDSAHDSPAFVRDGGLWYKDKEGIESQLAEAKDPKKAGYEDGRIYLSPNKNCAIAWHSTYRSPTTEYWIKCYPDTQSHPKLIEQQSKLAGNDPRVERPRLFDLVSKCEIETFDELFSAHFQNIHLGWNEEGTEYRFLHDGRGHQTLRIIGINCSGLVRTLYEETSDTFIDVTSKLYYVLLTKSDRLIIASERDGYNHLYLINLKHGKIENQITKGDWNVYMVERINEETEQIWMSTYGFYTNEDPYHKHLVRVNFDGTECQALTEGDGTHVWSWPPSHSPQYFIDSWSRVDLPPQTVVRSTNAGRIQMKVEGVSAKELQRRGWMPMERFHCAGRDGKTLIYGVIAKPANFDSSRSYPVIEDIYPGPYDFFTPKSFADAVDEVFSNWTDEGLVAVKLDGMGTNWRSKKFHDVCYKNINDAGFPDRIIWIKKAAETRAWMDIDRVGVFGGSAGGHSAASALLHFGHFYNVAVADSGQYDMSLAGIEWVEQWLGYQVDGTYEEQSTTSHAEKLPDTTKLMLVVGLLDHSVNPSSTFRFVQRLNKANKTYELVVLPDGGHSWGLQGYGLQRIKAFLRANLGS